MGTDLCQEQNIVDYKIKNTIAVMCWMGYASLSMCHPVVADNTKQVPTQAMYINTLEK